jgi:dihydroneopterin aldolase
LKQISDEIDGKVTPLLNQEQQQKFQAMREEHRRELVEKMASQVMEKVKNEVNSVSVLDVHNK